MPSSNNPASRRLRQPSPDFGSLHFPIAQVPSASWLRVHQSRAEPIAFSKNPNHRFSHPECPYRLLYLGMDLDTCLFERFGDEMYDGQMTLPESLWNAHSVSLLRCPALRACDLTNAATLAALRVEHTSLMNEKLDIPQAWGLAIQNHPANMQAIKYQSRFNGRPCLVIFDRDNIQSAVRVEATCPLETHEPAVNWMAANKICLY